MKSKKEGKLVTLDPRRRVALGKLGKKEHKHYLVEEKSDGTLIFRPAKVERD